MTYSTPTILFFGLLVAPAHAVAADSDSVDLDDEMQLDDDALAFDEVPEPVSVETRVRPYAELGLGISVPASTYQASPAVQIGGGVVLPWVGGRFRPFAQLALTRPGASGELEDDRLTAPFVYQTRQWVFRTTVGVGARLRPSSEPISPELELGLSLHALSANVQGTVDSAEVAPASEAKARVGLHTALFLDVDAGPGHLAIGAQLDLFGQGGVLYKDGPLVLITPMLAYRITP